MKELVEVIAKSLVDYPDEVVVTETENEKAIVLELRRCCLPTRPYWGKLR